ncbi:YidH family protein [Agriterribacter humi]|uniref:YidH family protein n=1 Tax=Agriterribacter humi TaxID=1104781 RepID=UPI00126410DC|nr:hypothetical protein [Agriterribacter humi]
MRYKIIISATFWCLILSLDAHAQKKIYSLAEIWQKTAEQYPSVILGKENVIPSKGYSGIVGIILVAVGTVTAVLSYIRYRRSEKQITLGYYKHSSILITVTTAFIFLVSVFLIVYLIDSI